MDHIGPYSITSTLAEGGMAIVYRGFQSSLKRPVAIKVLKQHFSGDPRVVHYFNRESLIIARLSHPNIIHIIDRGLTEDGMPYFVMDFIEGSDMLGLIRNGHLPISRKLDIIIQTCKALAYAHKNAIIHRDIKPANILIDMEGNALVTDFGIAQLYSKGQSLGAAGPSKEVLGTPTYMAPEQKTNSVDVTFASDIYSLGVVMYELFTEKRFTSPPKRPSTLKPGIPEPLERLILRCLLKDPNKRPPSIEVLKIQLLAMFKGAHIREPLRQKAFSGVPNMNDIASVLDVIRNTAEVSVYLLRHKQRNSLMLAKTFSAMNEGIKAARLFMSLTHEHIVHVKGVAGRGDHHIVISEYLPGGSLNDRLVMPHTQHEALIMIRQVCDGLDFAHTNRIVHNNIKPSNILFSDTERVKLSDFMPVSGRSFQESVALDILSVGILFYRMIVGFNPELTKDGLVPHTQFKRLPDTIKKLVLRLLSQKSATRFTSIKQVLEAIDALDHDFIAMDQTVITLDERLTENARKKPKKTSKPSQKSHTFLISAVILATLVIAFMAAAIIDPEGLRRFVENLFQGLRILTTKIRPH